MAAHNQSSEGKSYAPHQAAMDTTAPGVTGGSTGERGHSTNLSGRPVGDCGRADTEAVIDQVEQGTLRGELQVRLSSKPEANRAFGTQFEFIGAAFDTSDLDNICRRPADHILNRLRSQVPDLLTQAPMLIELR